MLKTTLLEIYSNKILVVGIISWAIAQILKFIIFCIINKKIDFSRLFGDGGMPSGHSATVSSMSIMSGLLYGLGSFEFAITCMFAIIVMHDAMGVRLETGKQARAINQINDIIETFKKLEGITLENSNEKLKEFVGHTPIQVLTGSILGTIIAFISFNVWF